MKTLIFRLAEAVLIRSSISQFLILYSSNFILKAKRIRFSNGKIKLILSFCALFFSLSGVISYHHGPGSSKDLQEKNFSSATATNESHGQFAIMGFFFSFCMKARNSEWGSSDFTNLMVLKLLIRT